MMEVCGGISVMTEFMLGRRFGSLEMYDEGTRILPGCSI
jgi:hypothetical protein